MNLQEHIRRILKEETYIKVSDDKYSNLIKNVVLDYVDFHICGLSVTTLSSVENIYLVILIVEKYLGSRYRYELQEYLNESIPLKIYVSISDGTDCEKYRKGRNIHETSEKKQSLLKTIEDVGLYDFIKMTGLSLSEIRKKIGELPKEVLKRYIREFILEDDPNSTENTGILIGVKIPISNNKTVRDIMVQDSDQIAVEIWGYDIDEYGHREQTEQYLTSINNLTNEDLLSIVYWMKEADDTGYWD